MATEQQLQVKKILADLKELKIAATTIDGDLGLTTGYLWKVKDGRKTLSDASMKKLVAYHEKKTKKKVAVTKKSISPVVKINAASVAPKKQQLSPYILFRQKLKGVK